MLLHDSELPVNEEVRKSRTRRQKSYRNVLLRMPLGFGPFPGPRQTEDGLPVSGWSSVSVTTATITFKTSKDLLASYLPHECFLIDSQNDNSLASMSLTRLDNLPWLDGRGYHHYGFYIHDVICQGKLGTVRGKYLVVLFENRADPIISGREELGYAKLFSDLNDELDVSKGHYSLTASWEGNSFGFMELTGLTEEAEGCSFETFEKPTEGILHFKSIPRTGEAGKFDAQYPTFSPNMAPGVNVVEKVLIADAAAFTFDSSRNARLPTISHVVAGLAEIEKYEVVDARVTISKGQSDLRDQKAILL